MNTIKNKKINFGCNILGPIFYIFCHKLYLFLNNCSGNTICLYAFRGGVRLHFLFDKFLSKKKLTIAARQELFFISRILVIKCGLYKSYDKAEEIILNEYRHFSFSSFVECFCPSIDVTLPQDIKNLELSSELLNRAFFGSDVWAETIQHYLHAQEKLFNEYFYNLTRGYENVIFIDTGWGGTIQFFLMKMFPDKNFHGLYFGKWKFWSDQNNDQATGLFVEGDVLDHKKPETAIFEYHHIIESPLEPNIPSIECLIKGEDGSFYSSRIINNKYIFPQANEYIFQGIDMFFDLAYKKPENDINRLFEEAKYNLYKKILYPKLSDVTVMDQSPRSQDFGKKGYVPILNLTGKERFFNIFSKIKRIKRSLWKQGKIRLEFPILSTIMLYFYNNRKC